MKFPSDAVPQLPTGTVTFLFTDIQGSTPLWEREPEKMAEALEIHNQALKKAIQDNGGVIFKFIGDEFQSAFNTAPQALKAAVDGQRALHSADWNELGELKVRIGLHTGEAELDPDGDEYIVSHTKNRAGRIRSAAYGGQILLSEETADLVKRKLPAGVSLKDLGEHKLKGMEWLEHLYRVCAPGLAQDFPPLATTITHPNNLPVQRTSFIGRETQVKEVQELLRQHGLVTLTGSGGVGKTRLSLQVAQELVAQYVDGVWLVELAPVADPNMVTQAVASVLGIKSIGSQPMHEILVEYLHSRQVLLVIDNCEHLIEACAVLVDELLRACPKVKILASSREALGVVGELPYRVPSLILPDLLHLPELAELEHCEAVRLFVERTRLARPDFRLTAENSAAVAQICQRLDGIPLAIELATARLSVLTIEQIASRLDKAFRLLTGGSRTALPRHQTLRATIDWSYQLLTEDEKKMLRRLAVFAGTFDLPAVEALSCIDATEQMESLDLLDSLVRKSILLVEQSSGAEARYRLLETVRQYAREKLYDAGESEQLHESHAAYYLELAKQGGVNMFARQAPTWLKRLEVDFPNTRVALSWALEGEALEKGIEVLLALWWYWQVRCISEEGYALLEKALSRVDPIQPSLARASLLWEMSLLNVVLGKDEGSEYAKTSREMFRELGDLRGYAWAYIGSEESIAILRKLGDEESLAFHLWGSGLNARYAGDLKKAELAFKESEHLYQKMGSWRLGAVYYDLGYVYFLKGQLQQARNLFMQSIPLVQAVGDEWGLMWVKRYIGELEIVEAVDEAGLDKAEAILLECLETAQKAGGKKWTFYLELRLLLAHVALKRRDFPQALNRLRGLLDLFQGFGTKYIVENHLYEVGQCFFGLAEASAYLDQAACSARLLGALDKLLEQKKDSWREVIPEKIQPISDLTRAKMIEMDFQAAWEKGREMTLEQAVAYALEEYE